MHDWLERKHMVNVHMFGTVLASTSIQHGNEAYRQLIWHGNCLYVLDGFVAAWRLLVLLNRVFVHSFCFTVPRLYVGEFFCPIVTFRNAFALIRLKLLHQFVYY